VVSRALLYEFMLDDEQTLANITCEHTHTNSFDDGSRVLSEHHTSLDQAEHFMIPQS
jgi:hypothetical protein